MQPRKIDRNFFHADTSFSRDFTAELTELRSASISRLRQKWQERWKSPAPPISSPDILLQMYTWRAQAEQFGGLDAKTERKLARIADRIEQTGSYKSARPNLSPGALLTREWKGKLHRVTVTAQGFSHAGQTYKSLSEVARAITGTHWSGPRFFGLEERKPAKRQVEQAAS